MQTSISKPPAFSYRTAKTILARRAIFIGVAFMMLIVGSVFCGRAVAGGLTANFLRCEYLINPIGLDEPLSAAAPSMANISRN